MPRCSLTPCTNCRRSTTSRQMMGREGFVGAAFIALGANLPHGSGSPVDTLRRALVALAGLSQGPVAASGFYRSAPKDCPPDSPDYVNAVAVLLPLPGETPLALLRKLQAIEQAEGRVRSGLRNEARTLDLDLLMFADCRLDTDTLTLPHPRAHERRFVLEPWCALAGPAWSLAGRTLSDWLRDCQDQPLQRPCAGFTVLPSGRNLPRSVRTCHPSSHTAPWPTWPCRPAGTGGIG